LDRLGGHAQQAASIAALIFTFDRDLRLQIESGPVNSMELAGPLYTISHYRCSQRCAAIFSQDDPRRSLRSRSYGTTSSEK